MKTAVPACVGHLGIVSLDARFLVDAGQPSTSSKPNQENHTYDHVSR